MGHLLHAVAPSDMASVKPSALPAGENVEDKPRDRIPAAAGGESESESDKCAMPLSASASAPASVSAPVAPAPAAAEHEHEHEQHVSKKALKLLGAEVEQVARSKALKQLGVTETDLSWVDPLFETPHQRERSHELFEKKGYSPKLLSLTGMSEAQVMRRKALVRLGISEDVLELEREKRLAAWSPVGSNNDTCDYPCVHVVHPKLEPECSPPSGKRRRSISSAVPFPGLVARRLSITSASSRFSKSSRKQSLTILSASSASSPCLVPRSSRISRLPKRRSSTSMSSRFSMTWRRTSLS
jgi:hypothetical protein